MSILLAAMLAQAAPTLFLDIKEGETLEAVEQRHTVTKQKGFGVYHFLDDVAVTDTCKLKPRLLYTSVGGGQQRKVAAIEMGTLCPTETLVALRAKYGEPQAVTEKPNVRPSWQRVSVAQRLADIANPAKPQVKYTWYRDGVQVTLEVGGDERFGELKYEGKTITGTAL